MTTTVNTIQPKPAPVIMGFWWNANGPEQVFTYDGDTFPYGPLPGPPDEGSSNERYKAFSTVYVTPVEFFATKANKPHVVAPAGVTILEYFWDFGDGTTGTGQTVSHQYKTLNEQVEVSLTVVDSRGLRFSQAKPVLLIYSALGGKRPYRWRVAQQGGKAMFENYNPDQLFLKASLVPVKTK